LISVIFYGRNDNHGYNLHKRASLSLNNIAELLSHEDDEILFVDWNTPPGLPTFIESIHDLLTDNAKELIKTIKVDFATHEKIFGSKTSKQTVEPVARNVAIVRSNPSNKWILSTNTDMIFIPKNSNKSLSDICSNLDDGFYELPRFSIPEILWETFDRLNPGEVMQQIKELRLKIDLDETITAGPILRFDAPGDFQLCLRSQLIEIHGFDENMILGWHVDSNLCRRLNILNRETKSLEHELLGYHCEHTKTMTHFTASGGANSLIKFVEKIKTPYYAKQDTHWGLSNITLSEFKVKEKIQSRFKTLYDFASAPQVKRTPIYANAMGNLVGYPESHAIPYLVDAIYDYPLKTEILFFGKNNNSFNKYKKVFYSLGYSNFTRFNDKVTNDYSIREIDYPRAIILDLGFDIGKYDISLTTHDVFENRFQKEELEVVKEFLNFVIRNLQEKFIFKIPIITLNAETYDGGPGAALKKWINLPNVASNSRVRIGFIKRPLLNRKSSTLKKMLDRTLRHMGYLDSNYFNKIELHRQLIDRKGIQLSSHSILPYTKNFSGLNTTRRGIMLNKFGFLELDFNNLGVVGDQVTIIELDRPLVDGNLNEISGEFSINDYKKNIEFRKQRADSNVLKFILNGDYKDFIFSFDKLNYLENYNLSIRLSNLGFFNISNLKKKLIFFRSSELRSRYFLENNWSFSNENAQRWTTDSTFTINLNKEKLMVPQTILMEVKHFKNSADLNFIKKVSNGKDDDGLKFLEIPRFKRQSGRFIYINIPKGCESNLTIETNAEAYGEYEIHHTQDRVLYSLIGAFGYSEGKIRSILLIATFPLFVLWVKTLKSYSDRKNRCAKFVANAREDISLWKNGLRKVQ
jgi:hypothetical protein